MDARDRDARDRDARDRDARDRDAWGPLGGGMTEAEQSSLLRLSLELGACNS